jgi:hypothetical protein
MIQITEKGYISFMSTVNSRGKLLQIYLVFVKFSDWLIINVTENSIVASKIVLPKRRLESPNLEAKNRAFQN